MNHNVNKTYSLPALNSLTKEQEVVLSYYYPLWANCLISSIELAKKMRVAISCFERAIMDYDSIF
ncbi:hypothetical protein CHH69_17905 [Terribacillus saccharophilus]|nr:hypothetical protein CHH69_17905 [Terribacillus saccharophilus]